VGRGYLWTHGGNAFSSNPDVWPAEGGTAMMTGLLGLDVLGIRSRTGISFALVRTGVLAAGVRTTWVGSATVPSMK
jgi:hypothetical protein